MMTKICKQCSIEKDNTEFYINRGICKHCKILNDTEAHKKQLIINPEVRMQRNKTAKQWRARNRPAYNAYQSNYQMQKYYSDATFRLSEILRKQARRSVGTLTVEEWVEICNTFNNTCAYCGSNRQLTMDHVIPVSKGGYTYYRNIIPACKTCNSSKHNKDLLVWFVAQSFYTEQRLAFILSFVKGGDKDE
jgi:5-methylcytosine-specific restriction endonuclease McrA